MLCSSSDWVFAGPKRSLGFVLADLGHDVWLTNVRGNIYGRNTTDEKVSWDFSFHEMGKYDLPAQIDYILDKTRAEKLYYIGYSMGTTAFYTMMSIKPKYNSKFKGMISLAPISFLNNVKGIMIRVIKYFSSFITSVLKLFNIRIVFKHPITFNNNNICDYPIIEKICVAFISSICGFDGGQYDKEMVSRYLAITPVGTSWKVAQHYFQLMESGAFRQFDYGSPKNQRLYGQEVPPDYDLEKFKVTVALIQGKNDYLSVFENELIAEAGYNFEIHNVTTNDGFIINIFRILPKSTEDRKKERPVVIIQHGIMCSSSDWVYLGKERGLGFALTDLGYDVWLSNFRGNLYGRSTVNASVSFDYSFHEVSQYDLPAIIDFILKNTGSNKLTYIGHSMGTTAFYVLMATKPEYNSKVTGMISLSPVSFMKHVRGVTIRVVKILSSIIAMILKLYRVKILLPEPTSVFGRNFYEIPIIGWISYFVLGTLGGHNKGQYDADSVTRYFKITPTGTAFKVMQHYFQFMDSGRFCQYDYGESRNEELYGQATPPDYNLKNVKVPIILIQGKNDYLTAQEDVDTLEKSLEGTSVSRIYIEDPNFTHLDFLWSKDIKELLHTKIISALKTFK
ncbi:lipase 1 isoform X2 [Nilaparvata lugens]|nr:lipase 1 isoform X2 [Nilaparvata lugens]